MRAALYARVSTKEGKQHLENQLLEMRRYTEAQAWEEAETYTDEQSGKDDNRPGLAKLMQAAARRQFDVVLVVELSRLTRGGPLTALQYVERLNKSGVQFWSIREEMFRTCGPFGPVLISIVAWVAEQERAIISRRVQAGLDRARILGRKLGRPGVTVSDTEIMALQKQGMSVRLIADALSISKSAVQRRIDACRKQQE